MFKPARLWDHLRPRSSLSKQRQFVQGGQFVISIRTFRNSDTLDLVRLWNAHRSEAGISPPLSLQTVEIVVLSRPYFQYEHLLVAEEEGSPVGFLHWLPIAENPVCGVIANVAIPPHAAQQEIATELFCQAVEQARGAGMDRLLVGQAPEHFTGYAGVGRCGMGGGIPDVDSNVSTWARQADFVPARQLLTFNLELATYRPPFDRELLAMRRSASVDRRRDITDQPFRIAVAMSHMEVHRFVASNREGNALAQVDVMLADPDMTVVSGGTVLLSHWRTTSHAGTAAQAVLRYAMTDAVAELAQDRAQSVQATIEADDTASRTLLESVGFSLLHRGTVYEKSL